ncbi:MAG: hypothetical protein Q7K43_00320 [Candidatus Woesearchaeota archaeon]|nr:hypothetical protein [Candidatus Woesearchaeota archaeon]
MKQIIPGKPPQFLLRYCIRPPFLGVGATIDSAKETAFNKYRAGRCGTDLGVAYHWRDFVVLDSGKTESLYFVLTNERVRQKLPGTLLSKIADNELRVMLVEADGKITDSCSADLCRLVNNLEGTIGYAYSYDDIGRIQAKKPHVIIVPEVFVDAKRKRVVSGSTFARVYFASGGAGRLIMYGPNARLRSLEFCDAGCWQAVQVGSGWLERMMQALWLVCTNVKAPSASQLVVGNSYKPFLLKDMY